MVEQLALPSADPLADAISWADRNPDAWDAMVNWAHDDRAQGIPPSTRYYACVLRRPEHRYRLGVTAMLGDHFLMNNNLTSNLARLLNRRFPELHCPTREAAVDRWAS